MLSKKLVLLALLVNAVAVRINDSDSTLKQPQAPRVFGAGWQTRSACGEFHRSGTLLSENLEDDFNEKLAAALEKSVAASAKLVGLQRELIEIQATSGLPQLTYLSDAPEKRNVWKWRIHSRTIVQKMQETASQVAKSDEIEITSALGNVFDRVDRQGFADPRVTVEPLFAQMLRRNSGSSAAYQDADDGLLKDAQELVESLFTTYEGRRKSESSVWELMKKESKDSAAACNKLAEYLDATVWTIYQIRIDMALSVLAKVAPEDRKAKAGELFLESQLFFMDKFFGNLLARTPEPAKTELGGACASLFHEDASGFTIYENEVRVAVVTLLLTLPQQYETVELEESMGEAEQMMGQANQGLRMADVVDETKEKLGEEAVNTDKSAQDEYKATMEVATVLSATGLWHSDRFQESAAEREEWGGFVELLRVDKSLSGACGTAGKLFKEGRCVAVTGKCLSEEKSSGVADRMKRFVRKSTWKDCGPNRVLLFGRDGFMDLKASGDSIVAARYVAYTNLQRVRFATYEKSKDSSAKNRLYLAFQRTKVAMYPNEAKTDNVFADSSPRGLDTALVVEVNREDQVQDPLLLGGSNRNNPDATAIAVATFLASRRASCKQLE